MATDKFIIALDLDSPEEALNLVRKLKNDCSFFKVGLQLYARTGPDFVRQLRQEDVDIFLDMKLHDIPATVSKAVKALKDLEVKFITLHTLGGVEMMQEAQAAVAGSATELLGVTILTSMDDGGLREIGFDHSVTGQVLHLARLGAKAGLGGLVCSPLEIESIRHQIPASVKLVTPGIRQGKTDLNDQKRTLSAGEALRAGANHLVIGRPVTQAPDPLAALHLILKDAGL